MRTLAGHVGSRLYLQEKIKNQEPAFREAGYALWLIVPWRNLVVTKQKLQVLLACEMRVFFTPNVNVPAMRTPDLTAFYCRVSE
jgi:hypothetical protein